MAIFADSISQIMSRLIAVNLEGGLMVAVLACLLQMLNHRNKLKKATAKTETAEGDLLEVGHELSDVRRDRMMNRLENRILREFIAQKNIEESISLLQRRFVPNQNHGFCLLVQFREGRVSVIRGGGISEESQQRFQLDLIIRERLRKERCIFLEGENANQCPLVKSLSPEDQAKVQQLHLIAAGNSKELSYALVTTDLYPVGGDRTQQQELAKKLMVSVSENFTMMQDYQHQQSELQVTHERLKLQSIADSNFCSPTEMMNEFLLNLQKMMNVDCIALYLAKPNENSERTALCRCGTKLQSGARVRWENHEQRIVEITAKQQPNSIQVVQYDRKDLAQFGVGTLIGRALVSRLQNGDSTLATICCTRSRYEEFTPEEIQLAQWAGSYLAEIIQRWRSLIEIERQAKRDPLTDLANRREFDDRFEQEMEKSKAEKTCCSLILIDLDNFKTVNDTYGHQAGDFVLKECAKLVVNAVNDLRESDRALPTRYGGEEIAILLPAINEQGAVRIAESIRQTVELTNFPFNGENISLTISAGVATSQETSMDARKLFGAADVALYASKKTGRNCVSRASELTMSRD